MFDALAARAVVTELNDRVVRGRVQTVLSLGDKAIGFEIYSRHERLYLLASAEPSSARVHLVSSKLRASGEPPGSLVLLLKKHAVGALISRVETPGRERILEIEFDHSEYGASKLIAEMMGRLSNLIFVDPGGIVLDAMRRISPEMSRARTVLPKDPYLPPPPQPKADPVNIGRQQLERILLERKGEPLWQVLAGSIAGTSPLLARELSFRVTGYADAQAGPALGDAIQAELSRIWNMPAEPMLAFETGRPVAVAAFALTHLGETQQMDSMSAALEKFYGQLESYAPVKEPLRRELEAAVSRLKKKHNSLKHQLVSESQVERLRISGELVLAHSTEIKPGQRSLRAQIAEDQPLEIKLDVRLTPVENAQAYFKEYRRAKDTRAAVPPRLQEAEADLDFADQVLEDLETAETRSDIDAVIQEARGAGLIKEERKTKGRGAGLDARAQPRVFVSAEGFQVLVGRNARENEEVTFRHAGAQDYWFHARGVPGAHVILVTGGRQATEAAFEYAAALAARYSKARNERWVDVVVAPRKNVGRVSGRAARPGLVTVRGEQTLRVHPVEIDESGSSGMM